jgi:PAS domain S-box-containing protein
MTGIHAAAARVRFDGLGPALLCVVIGVVGVVSMVVGSGALFHTKTGLWAVAAYFLATLPIVFLVQVTRRVRNHAVARQCELERDIQEHRKAEESLRSANAELEQRTRELTVILEQHRREKQRFEKVLNHLPVGVVLLSPDHHVVFANRLFRERFGEAEERPCFDYIHHRTAPCESCESLRVLETLEPHQWGSTCPDGTIFQIFSVPIVDPDGTSLVLEMGVDVTESQLVQGKLSEQAALLQLAHDAILVTDLDGRISFWNRGAEEIYGWRENEAVGGNVHELLQTASPVSLKEIKAMIQDLGQWEGEQTHTTKTGAVVTVASRWSLQRDDQGKPAAILEINRDITDRRRVEEELRVSRQNLLLALKAGRSGTFDWDFQNNMTDWSPEIEELYGLPSGGFDGRHESWESFLIPEDLARVRIEIEESLRTGGFQSEWRVRRAGDGQIRWLAARGTVLFDDAGRPTRMRGINIDVTDRKRAEELVRHSEERYRALIWATSQIVWTSDPGGVGTDSPSWRAFTGQSEEQMRGFGWADAIHPADCEGVVTLWNEAVRNRSMFEADYRLRHCDGEYRDMSVRGAPVLNTDGSIREWVGACTDITDRKRAQEALALKSAELARSNAELQRFAYVASHDLQEPLRIVANFTQLLAERYGSQLDDDAREFIAYAVGGARRMRTMIQDLLAYSRVETEIRSIEPVDSTESLGRALWNLRTSIDERAAIVSYGELPSVQANGSQLAQLFQNLIGNGIKFNRSTPPRVNISAIRNGGDWVFSVGDNGIGIEPQFAERIFVIFQRLHRSEEYPGTGIGLALCKKIVERYGGKIWVESKPGDGSTFFFSIPESSPVGCEVDLHG